jgi:hypothetical protein
MTATIDISTASTTQQAIILVTLKIENLKLVIFIIKIKMVE